MITTVVFRILLFIWFLGCTVSYRTRRFILIEGMGVKSAEFAMLVAYALALVLTYAFVWGRWVLFGVLAIWAFVQFLCHWRYTLFGASRQKLEGYNECFNGTLRLFPMSETRLIPDLYHIVLHALILINLILCLTD